MRPVEAGGLASASHIANAPSVLVVGQNFPANTARELIDLVKRGEMNLRTVVNKTSHAVADRFGIPDRGYIREGYWADLVLVDPHGSTTVRKEDVLYKVGWSPVEGRSFPAKILTTWVNGEIAYRDGQVLERPLGRRIQFVR